MLCRRQMLKLAREMLFKGEHGQNHDCKKDQFTDTKGYYIKEIVTRSFHDRIYIVSMGMNTKFKVDSHFSNAYPFIHFSLSMKL